MTEHVEDIFLPCGCWASAYFNQKRLVVHTRCAYHKSCAEKIRQSELMPDFSRSKGIHKTIDDFGGTGRHYVIGVDT